MIKAVFLDFYGTVVCEDNEVIKIITKRILKYGNAQTEAEIGSFWWQEFSKMFTRSHDNTFRTQRELAFKSLCHTIKNFESTEDAHILSQMMFDYWLSLPIFQESKLFFELCPVPIYVVSNIDIDDIKKALKFHKLKPEGVITSEEARSYKPRREIFELALKKFGLAPREVVHIGDSVSCDVFGAKKAGINAIWINRYNKAIPDGVCCVATNLLDVLKSRYFI